VVRLMVVSRFIGTVLAQLLLVPFSKFIAWVAGII